MSLDPSEYQYLVAYGPDANCTLALCPVDFSVYGYRPILGANIAFIVLFFLSMCLHIFQGIRYRTWFFMSMMILGTISELIGYGGRILLFQNPFSFAGFMIQIVCITIGPAFYTAGIYVTLTNVTKYLNEPSVSRFPPQLYWWLFIPCDIVSLVLQATGGAMSSTSSGSSTVGVNISLAGLCFQVFTLVIFCILCADYALRYSRFRKRAAVTTPLPTRFKVFVGFMALAILLILIRCAYRIDELSQGYTSEIIRQEAPFIGLESCMILIAVVALNVAHPGPAFQGEQKRQRYQDTVVGVIDGEKGVGFESDSSNASRAP